MIDSHSHIYTKPFQSDRAEVIERARSAGITQLLQVGCNLEESLAVVQLAEQTAGIYAAIGVHPHDADTWSPEVQNQLDKLMAHPKVLAFGEIGLDFFYDNSPREQQKTAFEEQLQFVIQHSRPVPVVIHTRDAEEETLDILKRNPVPKGGHVHCYTGTMDTARSILEMGFHLGFTGVITFKKAAALREVVAMTPLNRLLIETDSPYLSPMPFRGKRNEPARVIHIAEQIAEIKQIPLQKVLEQTTRNFKNLYGSPGLVWETL
ncbi:MAG: hydrolase TatD [Acidobacteria bacterium]|nr:MAG: hydrolase TatD [Acidobacteriota bacterium]PIE89685.1 MAG: hydrolase TatD [Acidobacteriota bacterium]